MSLVIVDEEEEQRMRQQVRHTRKRKARKKKRIADEVIFNTTTDKHVDNKITTKIYDNPKQHKQRIAEIPKRVLDSLKLSAGKKASWTLNHEDNRITLQRAELEPVPYTSQVVGTDEMPNAYIPRYVLNYFNARRGDKLTWHFNDEQGTVTLEKGCETSKVYAHSRVSGTSGLPRGTIPTELLKDLNLSKGDLLTWHVKGRNPDKVHVTPRDKNKKRGGLKYAE